MSEQTAPSAEDIGIHLRAAQQQLQALKSVPGINVDLTGIEQSINAALDLHGRAAPAASEADYSAFTSGTTEAAPVADADQTEATQANTEAEQAEPAPEPEAAEPQVEQGATPEPDPGTVADAAPATETPTPDPATDQPAGDQPAV